MIGDFSTKHPTGHTYFELLNYPALTPATRTGISIDSTNQRIAYSGGGTAGNTGPYFKRDCACREEFCELDVVQIPAAGIYE